MRKERREGGKKEGGRKGGREGRKTGSCKEKSMNSSEKIVKD